MKDIRERTTLTAIGLAVACGAFMAGTPALRADDTTPPAVAITTPIGGSTVGGPVTVTTEATDDVGVAGVQFLLNGDPLGDEDVLEPFSISWDTTLATNGSQTLSAQARDAAGNFGAASPVNVNVVNPVVDPATAGQWGPVQDWPVVTVHASMLADGRVLAWDRLDDLPYVWDPETEELTSVPVTAGAFCTGHCVLPNGKTLVIGGHRDEDGHNGIVDVSDFDATTLTWTMRTDMRFPRWYPTPVPLPDGRVLALSGIITDEGGWADTPEIYTPGADRWDILRGVYTPDLHTGHYPQAYVLPNGRVYVLNPTSGGLRTLDLATNAWISAGTIALKEFSSAMYRPGKILASGGGDLNVSPDAVTTAMTADLTQASPSWTATSAMNRQRFQHTLLPLADGTVFAVGGSVELSEGGPTAVLEAEQWDPATGQWTTLAAMQDPRMYHSVALLLQDGRVLVAGGGRWEGGPAEDYDSAELFSPPYLFKGPRPVITSAPATAAYGASINVSTPDAADIASVALVNLGSVTHTITTNQRYVPLTFTPGSGSLSVQMPSAHAEAPPGPYMLFILNDSGVPSVASVVSLPAPAAAEAPVEAFQEASGQVVMEAEHYDTQTPRGGLSWEVRVDKPGYSRSGFVQVLPNTGTAINSGYVTTSPELVFNVYFTNTGTYHVWVRGQGDSGSDDSLHAGVDGTGPASADRMDGFNNANWVWKRQTLDGVAPTLNITSPGLHTIHIWMREDGQRFDKLLLRKSTSSTAPSGTGPSESPRIQIVEDTTPPVISSIAASQITTTSARITWTTDEPATSQVAYDTDSTYNFQTPMDTALVTSHSVTLSGLTPGTLYHYEVRSSDASGNDADSTDRTFTTSTAAPHVFPETGGQVVIEAEHADEAIARGGQSWQLQTSKTGFSSNGYMQALPNNGVTRNTGYVTGSPELVYNVQFATTGTYYIWTRGSADSGNDDTVHFGVDGTGPSSADRASGFPTAWTWSRNTMDGSPATIVIGSTGLHTIHLWMREDGVRIDKILLRRSSSSTAPAGVGPSESSTKPRIMPVGDSITRGVGDTVEFGYRDHLATGLGLSVTEFVGTFQNPSSNATFDVDHEGVNGNRTDQVEARIGTALTTHLPKPNPAGTSVLLHIGTNDMTQGVAVSTAVDNVEDIIDLIDTYDGSVDIHVALIVPSSNSSFDASFTSYNNALRTRLQNLQASKSNLFIVDMNAAFRQNASWQSAYLNDSVHPNDAGYQVMADEWEQSVEDAP